MKPKTELREYLQRIRREAKMLVVRFEKQGDEHEYKERGQRAYRCANNLEGLLVAIEGALEDLPNL